VSEAWQCVKSFQDFNGLNFFAVLLVFHLKADSMVDSTSPQYVSSIEQYVSFLFSFIFILTPTGLPQKLFGLLWNFSGKLVCFPLQWPCVKYMYVSISKTVTFEILLLGWGKSLL